MNDTLTAPATAQIVGPPELQDFDRSTPAEVPEHEHHIDGATIARMAIAAVAIIAVWLRLWEPLPHISVIGLIGTLVAGWPIFKEAFENIIERRMTMELSM